MLFQYLLSCLSTPLTIQTGVDQMYINVTESPSVITVHSQNLGFISRASDSQTFFPWVSPFRQHAGRRALLVEVVGSHTQPEKEFCWHCHPNCMFSGYNNHSINVFIDSQYSHKMTLELDGSHNGTKHRASESKESLSKSLSRRPQSDLMHCSTCLFTKQSVAFRRPETRRPAVMLHQAYQSKIDIF